MYQQTANEQYPYSTPSGNYSTGVGKAKQTSYCTGSIVALNDADGHYEKKLAVRFSDDRIEESFCPGAKDQIVRTKSAESLHLLVLRDARRRRKVEALRDAILDQQIELWASTVDADYGGLLEQGNLPDVRVISSSRITSTNNNSPIKQGSFSKKLAFLSWRHSWEDVKVALEAATTLEASLS